MKLALKYKVLNEAIQKKKYQKPKKMECLWTTLATRSANPLKVMHFELIQMQQNTVILKSLKMKVQAQIDSKQAFMDSHMCLPNSNKKQRIVRYHH